MLIGGIFGVARSKGAVLFLRKMHVESAIKCLVACVSLRSCRCACLRARRVVDLRIRFHRSGTLHSWVSAVASCCTDVHRLLRLPCVRLRLTEELCRQADRLRTLRNIAVQCGFQHGCRIACERVIAHRNGTRKGASQQAYWYCVRRAWLPTRDDFT